MNVGKYKIIEKLSEGSFGSIYKGKHERTDELVAIKTEPKDAQLNSLKHEAKIYQYLSGIKGIPSLKWFGYDSKSTFLVLPLYSESLKVRKKRLKKIPMEDIYKIGKSILQTLKEIHNQGMVHCDLKPDNFLLNDDNIEQIYIIDFGFTRRFNPEDKKSHSSIGTPTYMSRRVHQKIEPKFFDDIESLLYVFIGLYFQKIPWDKPGSTIEYMIMSKRTLMLDTRALPLFFKRFIEIINISKENYLPEYEKLFKLFQSDPL